MTAGLLQDMEFRRRVSRFLMVGIANVGVDLSTYAALAALGAPVPAAKGVAFCAGTVFAFVANRRWTFEARNVGLVWLAPFFLLYGINAAVNVALNSAVLWLAGGTRAGYVLAYIVATGTSAALNFTGMHFLFSRARP